MLPFVLREVVQKFPELRTSITQHLLQTMSQIKSGKVFRGALWIVGEYSSEVSGTEYPNGQALPALTSNMLGTDIQAVFQELRKVLGEIPILASEQVRLTWRDDKAINF